MTTAPPDRSPRPDKDAADEPRRDRDPGDAPAGGIDDENPDFSTEFDHASGRVAPPSLWEP
jgi:hypothetical protein